VLAKGWQDVAAAVDATVQAVSDAADATYSDVLRPGWDLVVRAAQDEANAIEDAAEYGIHAAGTVVSFAAQAGSRIYKAATNAAAAIGKAAVHVVKTAYHDAKKAATATVTFVKNHAAAITSIVAGVAVFAGCETVTVGLGSIGCAALAGAASNMASYAVTAAQPGHFSVGGLLKAGVTGAVIGAATAGLLEGAGELHRQDQGRARERQEAADQHPQEGPKGSGHRHQDREEPGRGHRRGAGPPRP
jgi:hypothetical protein